MGPFVTGQPMAPCNGTQHSHTVDSGFQVLDFGFQSKSLLDSRFRILLHGAKPPRKRLLLNKATGSSSLNMLSFTRAKFCENRRDLRLPCNDHSSKRNLLLFSKHFCFYLCYIEALFFLLFM